jgi:hypothetical protein
VTRARRGLLVSVGVFLLLAVSSIPRVQADDDPQQARQGRRQFFLERSFFFLGTFDKQVLSAPDYYSEEDRLRDDEKVMFEAQPAPHLFWVNELTRDDLLNGTSSKWPKALGGRWGISFTFLARLRQLGGFSSPLRNPSFMPRISVQRLSVTRKEPGHFLKDNWIKVFGPQVVVWGHHSNGGAGCLFLEDVEIDDQCVSDIPAEQRRVNTRNGSFSTNYVRLGYAFLKGWPDTNGKFIRKSWTLGAWVELNPKGWGPGALEDAQRTIYGPERVGVMAAFEHRARLLSWDVNLGLSPSYEYIRYDKKPSPDASPHRVIVDATAVKDSGRFRGWGLAVRFYQGQDFNNLLFIRDIRRIQVGLAIDPQIRDLKE